MSSFKVYLNLRKIKKNGEAPIYLRIIKDRKSSTISLGYDVRPQDWDEAKSEVRKSNSNAGRLNNLIAQRRLDAIGYTLELEGKEKGVNTKRMKKAVVGEASKSFLKYAEKYLKDLEKKAKTGTLDKAKAVMYKVNTYMGNKDSIISNDLLFEDITVKWLKDYEMYLRTNLKNTTNTINGNYKIIRRLINEAINEDILPFEKNPFHKYKMKTEKTSIEYMTEEELEAIEKLQLIAGTKMDIHRDMYVFAAYTGGIRISDILKLRWKNFSGEHISIQMQKTGNPLNVFVPDKGLAILKKYKNSDSGKEDFIFPIYNSEFDYSDPHFLFTANSRATAYTNKDLKTIATKAGITKRLHFHTSRHTFATRALKKGMRMEYASKIMGHSNLKTTQIYAKIVNEELDKAMKIFN